MMLANTTPPCRCGHEGEGPHPCHYAGYTCRKPATFRLYNPRMVALAGVQMKIEASGTWACDECWPKYLAAQRAIVGPS